MVPFFIVNQFISGLSSTNLHRTVVLIYTEIVLITSTFKSKNVETEFKRPTFFITFASDTTTIFYIYLTKKIVSTPITESVFSYWKCNRIKARIQKRAPPPQSMKSFHFPCCSFNEIHFSYVLLIILQILVIKKQNPMTEIQNIELKPTSYEPKAK